MPVVRPLSSILAGRLLRVLMASLGTRLTSICTATIPSVDATPTDVDDAHRKVSVRAAQRPMFYGAGAGRASSATISMPEPIVRIDGVGPGRMEDEVDGADARRTQDRTKSTQGHISQVAW